jgi:hypothetical protein
MRQVSHHLRPKTTNRKKKEGITVRAEKKRTPPLFVPKTMNDFLDSSGGMYYMVSIVFRSGVVHE